MLAEVQTLSETEPIVAGMPNIIVRTVVPIGFSNPSKRIQKPRKPWSYGQAWSAAADEELSASLTLLDRQ